ncbi:MAG: DUF58 domain-containing protein, partial [Bacteroidia bacterium]
DEVLTALKHLKYNKHEVVLFHVLDHAHEIELEFENRPHIFIDKETNEKIKVNPHQIKEEYTQKAAEFIKRIKQQCLQYQIDYVDSNIEKGYYPILLQYFIKRQKMLR